jgi:hypothetical protein
MINEATLVISLVMLMFTTFAAVGYLFYILTDRIEMTKLKSTLYIMLQVTGTLLIAVAFYHFGIARWTDPSNMHMESIKDYSFYYIIGWNGFFGVLSLLYLINAAVHHIYAKKKESAF